MNAMQTIAGASPDVDGSPSEDPGGASPGDEPGESAPPPSHDARTVDVLDVTRCLDDRARLWLCEHAAAALAALEVTGEIRVRLVDDLEMARAHEAHCGVPGTTDVITFDMGSTAAEVDVDLLVCVDEARRQAATRGHHLERELLLYVVHGVLHCLGHDDHDPEEAAAMHRREDVILESIGVGRVYAGPAPGERGVSGS